MMDEQKQLREHLLELLEGESAHIKLETLIGGFPLDQINDHPDGSPHNAWELLEHIRIAQWDILEFCRNPTHVSPKWPDEYWPKADATALDWQNSVEHVFGDLQALRDLAADEKTDLFAKIPHGDGQTILRELLLVADHNAYHLGQLMLVKKMLKAE
jgi:hypothetical protein